MTDRDVLYFGRDELMNREDIRHFDVQSGFRLCVQIVELVNLEIGLRILHSDHFKLC